jgi:hypothetical protein
MMKYYLTFFYRFFLSRNPDESWARTRAAGLVLVYIVVVLGLFFIAIFKGYPSIHSSWKATFQSNQSFFSIAIIMLSFGIQFSLSYWAKSIDGKAKYKYSLIEKLGVWLTLPVAFLIFLVVFKFMK